MTEGGLPRIVDMAEESTGPGVQIPIRIEMRPTNAHRTMEVAITHAGTMNPTIKLQFSRSLETATDGRLVTYIPSENLGPGLYEVTRICLRPDPGDQETPSVELVGDRDFPRQFFEVLSEGAPSRSGRQVTAEALRREAEIESAFLQPLDIRQDYSVAGDRYCVLVFVKGLLIGTRLRMPNFEVVPTSNGLEARDELAFVQEFLDHRTEISTTLEYSSDISRAARLGNPVCVVHFPCLLAECGERSRDWAWERSRLLLLALSLQRGAGGEVFDVVVHSRGSQTTRRHSVVPQYPGNLLTGGLSGEDAESTLSYVDKLIQMPRLQLLTTLQSEALRERRTDFQYVRYWQILESIAEEKDYKRGAILVDETGTPFSYNGEHQQIAGAPTIVWQRLVDTKLFRGEETWTLVNVWFAFRSAVAHHGAVKNFAELSRPPVRGWAEYGMKQIEREGGDMFIFRLRETTSLILSRMLNQVD